MILNPTTDRQCLGQLTQLARELAPTTLVHLVAARLGSPQAVVRWLQSLPQSDDDGDELFRFISCDVPQRVRLFPDDPNCFERAFAALMVLEVLEAETQRMLVTIDRPLRHTGLVERRGARWEAVDLFPRRRNFDWGNFGKDILQGAHDYVGKPVLKFYLGDQGGKLADTIGEQENKLIGRDKKGTPAKKAQPEPAIVAASRSVLRPNPAAAASSAAVFAKDAEQMTGGTNAQKETQHAPDEAAGRAGASGEDGGDAPGPSETKKRWGWG